MLDIFSIEAMCSNAGITNEMTEGMKAKRGCLLSHFRFALPSGYLVSGLSSPF